MHHARIEPCQPPPLPAPPTISVVICAYTDERLELLAAGDRVAARPDRRPARDRAGDRPRAGAGGELPRALARGRRRRQPRAAGPLRRPQHRRRRVRRRGRRLPRRRRRRRPRTGSSGSAPPTPTPACSAPAAPCARTGRRGRPSWFPPEFDWVVGCTHSGMPQPPPGGPQPGRRQHVLPPPGAAARPAASATSWAGSARSRPAPRRPTSAIRVGQRQPRRRDPLRPRGRGRPLRPGRARPRRATSPRAAAARAARRRSSPAWSAASRGSPKSAPTPAAPCRWASCAASATPSAATPAASRGRRCSSSASPPPPAATSRGKPQARKLAQRRRELDAEEAQGERPLRVLMVTPRSPLYQGGVERHVMEVSKRVAADGAEVEVLCTEPGGPALAEEERDGVRIRTVRAWPANRDWCLAPRLWREMSRQRWDVVHVQSYHTLVAPLAMLRALTLGIPYVVTFHGGGHSSGHRNQARGLQRRLLRPLLRAGGAPGRRRPLRDRGVRRRARLPPEKFALIPNGTDLAFADTGAARGERNGAADARLDRPAGALQGPPPGDRRLPRGAASASRRRRSESSAAAPTRTSCAARPPELGIADRVEFTSTPADQPRGDGGTAERDLAGGADERVRDPPAGRARGGRRRLPPARRRRQRPRRARRATASPARSRSTRARRRSAAPWSRSWPSRRRTKRPDADLLGRVRGASCWQLYRTLA